MPKYVQPERPVGETAIEELVESFSRLDYRTIATQPIVRLSTCSDFSFEDDFVPLPGDGQDLEEEINAEASPLFAQQQNLNRLIQADPKNAALYLELVDLQDRMHKETSDPHRPTRAAVVDKQLSIIAKAKEECGTMNVDLIVKELDIKKEILSYEEMHKCWRAALHALPKAAELWLGHLDWLHYGVGLSRFKVDTCLDFLREIPRSYGGPKFQGRGGSSYPGIELEMTKRLGQFLKETDHTELLFAYIGACKIFGTYRIEDEKRYIPPHDFCADALKKMFSGIGLDEFKYEYREDLSLIQNWARMERATQLTYWAPGHKRNPYEIEMCGLKEDPDEPIEDPKHYVTYYDALLYEPHYGIDFVFPIAVEAFDIQFEPDLPRCLFHWNSETDRMPSALPAKLPPFVNALEHLKGDRLNFLWALSDRLPPCRTVYVDETCRLLPEYGDLLLYALGPSASAWIHEHVEVGYHIDWDLPVFFRLLRRQEGNESALEAMNRFLGGHYYRPPVVLEKSALMIASGGPLLELDELVTSHAQRESENAQRHSRPVRCLRDILEDSIFRPTLFYYHRPDGDERRICDLMLYYHLGLWKQDMTPLIARLSPVPILYWVIALQLLHAPSDVDAYRRVLYAAMDRWSENRTLMSMAQRLDRRFFRSPLRIWVERKTEQVKPELAAKIWATYISLQEAPCEALCERILQNEAIARYPEIWKCLLSCDLPPAKRKAVLYRAIAARPSYKPFYMEAIESPAFTEAEALEIFRLMDEKGLHVRRMLEECTLYK